ncbi:MAG: type II secretion system protein GspF [Deltaproteobacteria bacterium RIFOXYA12_FULL_61_11]|nr:MAG: type II secretion system protein GspF [Deltaproteobacteria bacterium RIFOXYA12_FULL_61_11]
MPVFAYKGLTAAGKSTSGLIDADSLASAKTKLRKDNIFPTELRESSQEAQGQGLKREFHFSSFLNKVKPKELSDMTRLLATLVGANVPLVESLSAIVLQLENPRLKTVVTALKDSVNEGSSLGQAMEAHPDCFSNLFVNMVKAGEASGTLELVLNQLADFTEKQVALASKVKSTLAYPVVMLIISLLVLAILFIFVIPKITAIYAGMKSALPLPTMILLGVSSIFVNYWWAMILLIAGAVHLFRRWVQKPKGRRTFDAFKLKLPVFGKVFRLVALSRFTGTLATLLNGGVPLLQALHIVRNLLDNVILREAVERASEAVSEGANLADPLRESGEFPPVVVQMIAVGEKTGRLEEMLQKISHSYDQQTDSTISTLTSVLEPLMIVFMGGTVGFVVISVLLPIFNLNQMAH